MSEKPRQRGGARQDAGRKKKAPGTKVVSRTISLPPAVWDVIEARRGGKPYGEWLARSAGVWIKQPGEEE